MSTDKDVEAHAQMVRDVRVRVQRLRARHEFYIEHGPQLFVTNPQMAAYVKNLAVPTGY